MGLVTLTFDLLTLKLVCESHQGWGTFVPNLGTLGLQVLELFAMYATDGQDGRTDRRTKAKLTSPFPTGGGIISTLYHSLEWYTLVYTTPDCGIAYTYTYSVFIARQHTDARY